MQIHGTESVSGMDNRRAAVADNGDGSQGRDAYMDHQNRLWARIDQSVYGLREAHICPHTWTVIKFQLLKEFSYLKIFHFSLSSLRS